MTRLFYNQSKCNIYCTFTYNVFCCTMATSEVPAAVIKKHNMTIIAGICIKETLLVAVIVPVSARWLMYNKLCF